MIELFIHFLRDKNCPQQSFELQLAHIVPKGKGKGGKHNFWNLVPTCSDCNSNLREIGNPPQLRSPTQCELAFNYWTFFHSRIDVAIKVALYKLYEYVVLDPDLTECKKIDAHRLLYYILWSCRTYLSIRAIKKCLDIIKLLPCGGGIIISKEFDDIENLIYFHDSGKYKELQTLVLENPNSKDVQRRSKSIIWRLKQDPSFPQEQISRLDEKESFVVSGADDYYRVEKDFDLKLRKTTSELIKGLIKNDKQKINQSIDTLLEEKEIIRSGKGCAYTYQRLYPFLKVCSEKYRSSDIAGILEYTKIHGSESPIRKLFIPKSLINTNLLKKYLPIEQINGEYVNIGSLFEPTQYSYGYSLENNKDLIKEDDLLEILDKIIYHLKSKKTN